MSNRTAPSDRRALDRLYVSGVVWTALSKWGVQLFTWSTTILVVRLLRPEDYGIIGMARLFISFSLIFSEAGLGAAILRFQGLTHTQVRQLNSIALSLGGLLAAGCILLSGAVGSFFGTVELEAVLGVMSITLLMAGARVVPYALLRRDLEYRYLAAVDGGAAMVGAAVTLAMAILSPSYWALVVGAIVESVLLAAMPLFRRRVGFAIPSLDVREAIIYGLRIISQQLSGFFGFSADRLLVGKVLGQAPLGAYSFALTLSSVPIEKVSDTAVRVTSTVLAAVQESSEEMARYLLRTTETLSLVTVPACLGLGLVASDLVLGLLGEKWDSMILPLRIVSLVAASKAVLVLGGMVANLRGREVAIARLNMMMALVFPVAVLVATRWDIVGVAVAWALAYPVFGVIRMRIACTSISLPISRFMGSCAPSIVCSAFMSLAVLAVQGLASEQTHLVRLAVSTTVGAVTYGSCLWLGYGDRVRKLAGFVRRLRSEGAT